jgi:amino acid adenylation domain-containing protein
MHVMNDEVRLLLKSLSELNIKLDVNSDKQLVVNAPNGVMTPEITLKIKKFKPELLDKLIRRAATIENASLPIITPALDDRFETFPLNDIQHAYWFGRNAYVQLGGVSTHFYCEFTCPALDVNLLNSAFNRIVQQHDMLRAVVTPDGKQRVLEHVPQYAIVESDLRHNNESDRQTMLASIRAEMSQQVIDCETWPLFDLRASNLSDSECRLFFSWDFLVVDAWSILNILNQWRQLYDDPSLELKRLPLTFRDYLIAEESLKKSKGYQISKDYWWDRIDSLPLAPTLPVKANIEVGKKHEFTRRTFSLAPEKWQFLLNLCKSNAITPTNLLLSAFSEVLNLWSKNDHYSLNLTLFNRLPLHENVMDLVGDFTSLVITEIGAQRHETFIQRAKSIQKQALADYENKQVSGVEILREIAKRHGLTQTALMPVVFTSALMLDSNEYKKGENDGLEQFGDMTYGITQTPQVWLDCQLFEVKGKLLVNWDAVEELFEPNVLDSMFSAFEALIGELASSKKAWISSHPLEFCVDQSAVNRINSDALAQSPLKKNEHKLLHTDFMEQASLNPDSIAVISGPKNLTYRQLLTSSVHLADKLRQAGVAPNELVAVSMKKGWEQVVAVIGVLISGAAYLPIDPDWPYKRRSSLIEFSKVKVLLTDGSDSVDYSSDDQLSIIEVSEYKGDPIAADEPVQEQSDIAYVIFTSGSTGTPKGVVVNHLSALNTILAVNQKFNVTPEDRVFGISSLSFDLSVYDVFGPLSVGAALVIPEDAQLKDPVQWQNLIRSHRISIWNSAPQWMNMLLDYNGDKAVPELASLRLVMMSGDWIKPDAPERIKHLVEGCRVVSLGGATEGAIWSIYYSIDGPHSECISVPYGMPLPGQTMHVLNKQMQGCPAFVIGDIYIGGVGVAMGYLNDEVRTNERFIVHPITKQRLYWTGDIGRYLTDGNIEFLGREDRQVKLHGHRVELDEVSSQLKSHPCVDDAVVQIMDNNGSQFLEAYVITRDPSTSVFYDSVEVNASGGYVSLDGFSIDCDEIQRNDLAYFYEFWQTLTPLYLACMLDTLLQLTTGNEDLIFEDAIHTAGVQKRFIFLCNEWIEILLEHEWITHFDGRNIKVNQNKAVSMEDALQIFESTFDVDQRVDGFYDYIKHCLNSQIGLLKAEVFPLELLFPNGDQRYAASIYETNPAAAYHNAQLANVLQGLIKARGTGEPLRILEVGAGTGGATRSLLQTLPHADTEYWFTDLSSFFFDQAKQKFDNIDCLQYGIYNIDLEPQSQGFSLHSFDFIVGVNVLHDAKHMGRTLNYLRQLLKPNGHLMMIEGTQDTLWQWVTVGYLEGIGEYEDLRKQTKSPLLSVEQWHEQLSQANFVDSYSYPEISNEMEDAAFYLQNALPQNVIVARAPESILTLNKSKIKEFLSSLLPSYMVPQSFVGLSTLPLTANGKIDFSALSLISAIPTGDSQKALIAPDSDTEKLILKIWREVLSIDDIGVDSNFFDLGGDSLLLTRVLSGLNELEGISLDMADLFTYPTINTLSDYLTDKKDSLLGFSSSPAVKKESAATNDIAIIGMSGRFPDAHDVAKFWQNIERGFCSVRQFDDEQLLQAGVSSELLDENYVKAGVVLDDMDKFDAPFFDMTPREAQITDPQLRVLLECAVSALEDAGYPNERYGGKIGVYVGKDVSQYFSEHLVGRKDLIDSLGMMSLINVNEKDYAATQISYRLNLTGPSLNILTACSTSLVAIHQACKSILGGECNIALAGGVSIETNHKGYAHKEGSIASVDGYCRAFSEDATGCVRGSGAGLVVLKPLALALKDNDNIHAVIKGSAVNNDGRNKVGFTAPSVQGQASVITSALADAGVSASDIHYIETHGTGTALGDPIETKALARVFNHPSGAKCMIGSLKTNIGHLDAAAGVAGLIKTVCSIKNKKLPPSLHFKSANPGLDLADGAISVSSALADWQTKGEPRMAGVSSFGVGGTNAHVILQEAPEAKSRAEVASDNVLILLSAKQESVLSNQAENLREYLLKNPHVSLVDIAYTLQVGRNEYKYRSAYVCNSSSALVKMLTVPSQTVDVSNSAAPKLVFMFPGQGSQQVETTYQLYQSQPVFRHNLDKCAELLETFIQQDIRTWLYASYADEHGVKVSADDIKQTSYAQPLLFAIEYSLARYWMSLGLSPDMMIGHSIGEYVAACLAGVFSLEEALSLVAVRGQLMQSVEPGSMLAVRSSVDEIRNILEYSDCEVAAINGPQQCVLSGPDESIDAIAIKLSEQKKPNQKLETSHAFHSCMMEPILDIFEDCVRQVTLSPPSINFMSNLSGDWITPEQATDPRYWVDHLRNTVNFFGGIQKIVENDDAVFLEVGVGTILSGITKSNGVAGANVISSLGDTAKLGDENGEILASIKQLWLHGLAIDWRTLYNDSQPQRKALPTYAFERHSYWITPFAAKYGLDEIVLAPDEQTTKRSRGKQPLDEPGFARPSLKSEYVAAQSKKQVELADLWQKSLGIETIGIKDNFFELGGDSLQGIELNRKMKEEIGISIPMDKLVQLGTIRNILNYTEILSGRAEIDALSDDELDDILNVLSE